MEHVKKIIHQYVIKPQKIKPLYKLEYIYAITHPL